MTNVIFVHTPKLTCATASLPDAPLGTPYALVLQATGGTPITGSAVSFTQPSESGISGNVFIAGLQSIYGKRPINHWFMGFWQQNVNRVDGDLVTNTQDNSALTGFAPVTPATAQVGCQDVPGSSVMQMEGTTVGAYINTNDIDTTLYDKMMMEPEIDFSVPPAYPFQGNGTLATSLYLQVPTATGVVGVTPPVYVTYDLRFIDANGLAISFGVKLFRMGADVPATGTNYVTDSNVYTLNSGLGYETRFYTKTTDSEIYQSVPWTGFRRFAFTITSAQFELALRTLDADFPGIISSFSPSAWGLIRVHLNAELLLQGGAGPYALGWSMRDLAITGGASSYAWTMTPASVNGITLTADGILTGTPVAARTDTLDITLADAIDKVSVSRVLTAGAPSLTLTGQVIESRQAVIRPTIARNFGGGSTRRITCTPGTITASATADTTLTGLEITSAQGSLAVSISEASGGGGTGTGTGVDIAVIRAAGYIIATDAPYNCDPTGVADSTAGLQAAIDAGCTNFQPVFLPNQADDSQGLYKITDTLRFYVFYAQNATAYAETSGHVFLGATNAQGQHPTIQLAANTAKFNSNTSLGYPVPMIAIRSFTGSGTTLPSPMTFDPYTTSPNASYNGNGSADVWDGNWANFNLDTNSTTTGNTKACGMVINGAQTVYLNSIFIKCTNAVCGISAAPGNGSVMMDFHIQGGQYGVDLAKQITLGWQGDHPTFVGLTCSGQSIACMRPTGTQGCEVCVVGFSFAPDPGGTAWADDSISNNADYTACFLNGTVVGVAGGAPTAFPNSDGRDLYLGDVYISGFTNVTKFASNAAKACAGNWTQVVEYCATSQKNLAGTAPAINQNNTNRSGPWPHYNFINGVQSQSAEPVATINTNFPSASVPTNLISRHVVIVPTIDNTLFLDISAAPYNAVPLTVSGSTHSYSVFIQWSSQDTAATNNTTAIQAAIDAAPAGTAILIPNGVWEVGSPGLSLNSNTVLMGLGRRRSVIATHRSWQPTTLNTPVLRTPADSSSNCALVNFGLHLRRAATGDTMGVNGYPHDNFILFDWQSGGECFTWGFYGLVQFLAEESSSTLVTPALWYQYIHGSTAGGRFYGLTQSGDFIGIAGNHDARPVMMADTTQPCYFYSFNIENSKQTNVSCNFNLEATNCDNIRIFGAKREGFGSSVKLSSCNNVGFFGSGVFSGHTVGETEIGTGCSNILLHNHQPIGDSTALNLYDFVDDVSGVKIARPKVLSLYKRGTLNDDAMVITSIFRIATSLMTNATVGTDYSFTFTAINGSGDYTWSMYVSPNWNGWLTLTDTSNGICGGLPQLQATESITVSVYDNVNDVTITKDFTLTVNPQ